MGELFYLFLFSLAAVGSLTGVYVLALRYYRASLITDNPDIGIAVTENTGFDGLIAMGIFVGGTVVIYFLMNAFLKKYKSGWFPIGILFFILYGIGAVLTFVF